MTITEMVQEAHKTAVEHGFWDDVLKFDELNDVLDSDEYEQYIKKVIGCCLMLITSELAEALEELRHSNKRNFAVELADAVIRICDLCGFMNIDLEKAIAEKMAYNKNRPYKHGKAF